MTKRLFKFLCLILVIGFVAGCGGPEQKKMKFFNKGKALYEKGDLVKAKLEFKNAIQIDPKFSDAYYMLGMVELRGGNFQGAFGAFNKAVELNPLHWDSHIQMGRLLLGARQFDKALEKADLVLKENPKNEDALLLKGSVFLARKESEKAQQLLEGLIGQGMSRPDVYMLLASAYMQKEEVKKAEGILQKGVEINPKSVMLNLVLSDVYIRSKRMDEAVATIQSVIELEPKNIQYRIALAGIYWESKKEKDAQDVLKNVIALDPKNEEGWLKVAGFYVSKRKFGDAEQELRAGLKQIEKSFKLRFALSELYLNFNMTDKAIAMLKECLALEKDSANPDIIHTKNDLAKIYLARQELDEAKKYVDEVLKESPKNADAQFTSGNIYLLKGDGIKAVSAFRTVVGERPQFIPGQIRLAEAHALNREPKLALDTLQNALKIDPNSRRTSCVPWHVSISFKRILKRQKKRCGRS